MGAILALAFLMGAQNVAPAPPAPAVAVQTKAQVIAPAQRCDARPWQRLVGRTISDLLTITLPAGTRIFRLDDPPSKTIIPGQLTIEINRSTRVRRVYCS